MPDAPAVGETSLEERVAHIEQLLVDDAWAGRVIWRGGYPRTPVVDALPTAGEIYRYALLTLRGDGATTPDILYACLRTAAGVWGWRTAATG